MDNASRFFGEMPGYYDRGLGPVLFHEYTERLARNAARREPRRILETAAGTGLLTRRLRDMLAPDAEIVATDLNAPMLAVAREKFRSGDNVSFEFADALDLPFGDGEFDLVCCQFAVMFFPDKPKSFVEVRRVLRPGGAYLFSLWDSQAFNPFASVTTEVVQRAFGGEPPTFYRTPFGWSGLDALRVCLDDAGFGAATIELAPSRVRVEDWNLFSEGLLLGNPIGEEIRARGLDPRALVKDVATALSARFGGEMPLRALLVVAERD